MGSQSKRYEFFVMSSFTPTEYSIQRAFMEWVKMNKRLEPFTFHIPNGGYRNKKEGAILKSIGVKRGVPDIFIALPNDYFHGLWIEFKADNKKSMVSKDQFQFLCNMIDKKYAVYIAYDWLDAKGVVENYLCNVYDYSLCNDDKLIQYCYTITDIR